MAETAVDIDRSAKISYNLKLDLRSDNRTNTNSLNMQGSTDGMAIESNCLMKLGRVASKHITIVDRT